MIEKEKFYKKIQLSDECIKCVEEYRMERSEYEQWKKLFWNNYDDFLEKIDNYIDSKQKELYLYVQFAIEVYDEFKMRGISEQIYFSTMKDITIWSNSCLDRYKKPGLISCRWVSFSIKRKVIRLGRLQFEPVKLEKEIIYKDERYERGVKAVKIHIPEDGKLDEESCKQSLIYAKDFFGSEYKIYMCDSWLLSPKLLNFMGTKSNIIRFQKRFNIYEVDYSSKQAEQRVFGTIEYNKDIYPEHTSLQKNLKHYLQEYPEEEIGVGKGILSKI